jgi:hypothetical protein
MAASSKGTAHFFGIGGTITNATIVSINTSKSFELNETTEDESGVTIETHRDNRVFTASVTLRMKSGYTFPDIGDTLALAGLDDTDFNKTYEITEKGQVYQNNQHVEQTLELVHHEGITYT